MQYDSDTLAARAEKEEADARSAKSSSEGQKLPRRYKLYDRIKENVSLRTIDAVILCTAALIIIALIYGILTATPPQ
ncbi:MAG: hypothetical protein ILP14_05895 [Oscillospiraceae bacterium]|nr:hypothetical protein [Oscillospiraceae bacterium]